MKVTREVKDYIRKRIDVLLPTPSQTEIMEELKEEAKIVCMQLHNDFTKLVAQTLASFIDTHPDAVGLDFHILTHHWDSKPCCISANFRDTAISKELDQARRVREQQREQLEEIAIIDAVNCKTAADIDAMLIELINR